MSTVLFDTPGPQAARRHRLYTWISAIVLTAILAAIVWKLYAEGEFEAELWEDLSQPNIWNAIGDGLVTTLSVSAVSIVPRSSSPYSSARSSPSRGCPTTLGSGSRPSSWSSSSAPSR
jgi:glutamate transport system permease protein